MEGYAKIASRIALNPELGIYRKFAALNAQNLLYLQAEIHGLEQELRDYAQNDADALDDQTRKLYSRDWNTLANARDHDRRQWDTVCQIREKLKEYNDFLLQQVVINSGFREPRSYNLRTLQSCLRDAALPDYLLGRDSQIWEEPAHRGDLMSLDPSGGEDAMTVWISANLVAPFHTVLGKHLVKPSDSVAGLYNYSDRAITKISSLIATVLSSVLPIVGVIVLYFVADTLARIGIIAAMTALFSCCLALLTAAKKSEIFAATAAFSAVLVVFLGSNP